MQEAFVGSFAAAGLQMLLSVDFAYSKEAAVLLTGHGQQPTLQLAATGRE